MKFFYDLPLRKKLIAIIAISSVFSLLIIATGMFVYETKTFQPRILKQVRPIANLYGLTMTAPLLFQDPKAANENISTLQALPEISMACIYNSKQTEFANYIRYKKSINLCPSLKNQLPSHVFDNTHLHYFHRISYDKDLVGTLYIQYHLPSFPMRFFQYALPFIVVLLAIMVVSILILSGLQRFVNSPILLLAQTAQLISSKNEYDHRVDYQSRDEVGKLTRAFNGMLDTIELSFSQNRATLEATADGILVVNHEGGIVEYNQKFLDIFKFPESVLKTRQDKMALDFAMTGLKNPEQFLQRVKELYTHPDQESKDLLEFNDGRFVERLSQPQKIGAKIVGRVWSFRDITAQYESEKALRKSEAKFRRVFDSNLLGIMFCDREGLITEANDYFLSIIGYSREDLKKGILNYKALTPEEFQKRDEEAVKELDHSGICEAYEKEYLRKDGTRVPVLLGGAYLEKSRSQLVSFFLDISERKRAEHDINKSLQQEMQARRDTEKALQAREDFMSIAAHELRTPLTPLKLQNDALKVFLEKHASYPETDTLLKFLNITEQQIDRLIHLVDDLLDVTRIRTGRLKLYFEKVDLPGLVQDIVNRYQDSLIKNNIELKLSLQSVQGFWDRLRIEQVVINLLTNAIKYGNGSQIQISVIDRNPFAEIIVQDYGLGIDEADKERIFNRFERATSIQHYGGFGLGLYITKQIVEAHKGHITVESTKGQGAKFIVKLPYST